jgi:hypothetical protein
MQELNTCECSGQDLYVSLFTSYHPLECNLPFQTMKTLGFVKHSITYKHEDTSVRCHHGEDTHSRIIYRTNDNFDKVGYILNLREYIMSHISCLHRLIPLKICLNILETLLRVRWRHTII